MLSLVVFVVFAGGLVAHSVQTFKALERQRAMSIETAVKRAASDIDHVSDKFSLLARAAGHIFLDLQHDPKAVQEKLDELSLIEPFAVQISIIDQRGTFLVSNRSAIGGLDLSDRPHIKAHFENSQIRMFISTPLIGRVSKQLTSNVTTRFYDRNRRWIGIVVVSYDVLKVVQLLSKRQSSGIPELVLLRNDGSTLLSSRSAVPTARRSRVTADMPIECLAGIDGGRTAAFYHSDLYTVCSGAGKAPIVVIATTAAALLRVGHTAQWMTVLLLCTFAAGCLIAGRYLLVSVLKQMHLAELARISAARAEMELSLVHSSISNAGVLVAAFDSKGECILKNGATSALLSRDGAGIESCRSALLGSALDSGDNNGHFERRLRVSENDVRVILWTTADAPWLSDGAVLAFGFDKTAIDDVQRELHQKSRLVSLGVVSTGLAHEMAQPLTVISLEFSMLRNSMEASDLSSMKRSVDALGIAIARINETVSRMKLFGRARDSSLPETFHLTECMRNTFSLLTNELALDGITLRLVEHQRHITLDGDIVLFSQVLMNVILNARDAMISTALPSDDRSIVVECNVEGDSACKIAVRDNGPGVPAEFAARIFDPFFTTKPDGTGLGLSLSYGIIKNMGGTISLIAGNKGATFEITVPCRLAL